MPKRNFIIYLIMIWIFIIISISIRPLLNISHEYFQINNVPAYKINKIIFFIEILTIILLVFIYRYNKIALIITASILSLNSILQIYNFIIIITNQQFVFNIFILIILMIINVFFIYFLLSYKTMNLSNDFSKYYKEKKVFNKQKKLLK